MTPHQLAPLFGASKSAAARTTDRIGPLLALEQWQRLRVDTVSVVDDTPVPARDHDIAGRSKNYGYSTNHQVVIEAAPGCHHSRWA
ncbi:hypothetical protein Kpho01_04000 [Kitasatospora phosalacinea]|uniref:Uncharacterized protein n=1 Tax=Kitasatospora phosalacinea TaxID=2065 RepID=A0A9W6PAZ1_9ACTN|nr:hypothetical protein Kpho01_04000 [Kitasatospora phosalacinea]